MRSIAIVPIVLSLFPLVPAAQTTQPRTDEAAVIEQVRTSIRFEADGTGSRETSMRVKAQSEAGVQQWGQVALGYNAATERLDIPVIRVKKADGSVVATSPQAVQDLTSPVQRVAPVYTDFHQKHITVESFRPGDTLEVDFVTTIHTPLAPGNFWIEYVFNDDAIVLDEQLDIDVPAGKPIVLKTLPGFEPTVKDADGRRIYHWSHAHPARSAEEPRGGADARTSQKPDDAPRAPVRLTTFTDWKAVGAWFAGLERTARTPTPEIRKKARELTAGRATDTEKIEALYDYVSKNFRYVSLSLGLGRYQPRPAGDVLRDAYGDCKDKHTLLASLLEAAGFDVAPVLINSQMRVDPEFPSPSQFDHVITRVVAPDAPSQPIWLDATPEVAPFRLLSAALRRKQALVAAPSGSRLETTPADPPMPSVVTTAVDGRIDPSGALSAHATMTLRGDAELILRMVFRTVAEPEWKQVVEAIVKESGLDAKLSDIKVSDPQATKAPFTLQFTVDAPRYAKWSASRTELALPLSADAGTFSVDEDDSGPIALGAPGETSYILRLELPADARARAPVPVSVSRDYGDFRAEYALHGTTLTADRRVVLRQSELPNSRRADCAAFANVIAGDLRQRLSVETAALTISGPAVNPDAEIKDLNQSGSEALGARDYERARVLLERVVELSPRDRAAWNNLGRAYMGLRQTARAIGAFKKQIEVNPYDAYAYNNLGLVYAEERKYAEAEAAFQKQIDINPLDKYAHTNLGHLYVLREQFDKAAPELEKAANLTPDVASLQVQLGKVYLQLHRAEDARAAFGRAVELSPAPGTWNDVAYEMALAGTDLTRARQYAESAIAAASAASRNIDLNDADARAMALVTAMGSYWDTLGWVYFAEGDLAQAERYVSAAWRLTQHAEVGDHLGQIYEKTGHRDAAVRAYAEALAALHPLPATRQRLARAAGGAASIDSLIAEHLGNLSRNRTLPLPARGPAGKKADFIVLFASPGRVEAVSFVEGDEDLRILTPALRKIPSDGVFPDDTPARLIRRGIAACDSRGTCTFTLLLPEDARPVK